MTLAELISPLDVLETSGSLDGEVCDITDDSRNIRPGSLFVAVKGGQVDGHAFTGQAMAQGAVGVVVDTEVDRKGEGSCAGTLSAPQQSRTHSKSIIRVKNSRHALGLLASRFYGDPSQRLRMIGVTGTNGKTTVTHLIQALVNGAGKKAGIIGTVGYFIESTFFPASHTTPGAVELQSLLGKMVAAELDSAVLEVSSHALSLDRVTGCEFDVVVFTNLTQDHLDFHADLEEYFQAKLRLFTELVGGNQKSGPKRAIVNVDDERGVQIVHQCPIPVWSYGIHTESDIRAQDIQLSLEGTQFRVQTPKGTLSIQSQLVGDHNVYNLLAAIGVGLEIGMASASIELALHSVKNVPGRFERIDQGQDFTVVVDYAHTEDALVRLLAAANSLKKGRIITVFGCGGDRDSGKRPQMGQVAVQRSDFVFLTSDNPRTEDPMLILQDIERGILNLPNEARCPYQIVPDRATAIEAAIKEAQSDDMVLIAGKGHEDYQLIGSRRLDFDDRQVAREAIVRIKQLA